MEEKRKPKFILIIGYNGTGKTTFLKQLVQREINRKDGGRALIITPDDQEWSNLPYNNLRSELDYTFCGAQYHIFFKNHTLESLKKGFYNGLLVFDDCRGYFRANVENDEDLHTLLIRRRQKMTDIVAVGHGFTEIPPKFFTFASEIVLFKTMDNISKRKDVLKDFDKMQKAQARINKKADKDPYYKEVIRQ